MDGPVPQALAALTGVVSGTAPQALARATTARKVVGRELTFRAVLCHFGHAAAATDFGRAAMISDVPGQEDGAQPFR